MRVIVLNDHGYVSGGAAQVAISSLNGLAEAGLDVTFVSGVGPVDSDIDRNLVRVVNFGFHDLLGNPSRFQAAMKGIWDSRCANLLRELLLDYDPEDTIVHLHTWVKSLTSCVAQVADSLGFRVVCTLHDYFSVCPNGALYNYPQKTHCKLRPMSLDCITTNCDSRCYAHKLWRVGRQAVQGRFGGIPKDLRYFISVSDYSESILRPLLPAAAKFFRVVNPIDIERGAPSGVGYHDAFTFVGRLSPEKGADVFALAAKQACVRAVFVGSGPEEARIAGINPSAVFRGWQNRAGVARSIQTSRAVVFPSLLHETQGMVVVEAAALGIPSIVSDACAARDSIIDEETGRLFKAGSAADLKAKLTLLDSDRQLAARLGLKAYERYWSTPSTMELHVKQLISCYAKIMGFVECS